MWPFKSKAVSSPSSLPIFRSLEDKRGLLEEPVEVGQNIHAGCNVEGLFAWGIFNPYGPTLSVLSLLNCDSSGVSLVHHRLLNPFVQRSEILAVVNEGIQAAELANVLSELFAENTIGDSTLVKGWPSFLLFGEFPDSIKLCLYCLHCHIEKNDRMDEVVESLQSFRRFPGDPWARASHGIEEALDATRESASDAAHSASIDAPIPFDLNLFTEWANLIISEQHMDSELLGFLKAWRGSIEEQGTPYTDSALDGQMFISLISESNRPIFMQFAGAIALYQNN